MLPERADKAVEIVRLTEDLRRLSGEVTTNKRLGRWLGGVRMWHLMPSGP